MRPLILALTLALIVTPIPALAPAAQDGQGCPGGASCAAAASATSGQDPAEAVETAQAVVALGPQVASPAEPSAPAASAGTGSASAATPPVNAGSAAVPESATPTTPANAGAPAKSSQPGAETATQPPARPLPPRSEPEPTFDARSSASPNHRGILVSTPPIDVAPSEMPPPLVATPEALPPVVGPAPQAAPGPRPSPVGWSDDRRLYQGLPWDFCGPKTQRRGRGKLKPSLPAQDTKTPVQGTADRVDYDREGALAHMQGGVKIDQGERHLESDWADYWRNKGDVDAQGHVYLEYPGTRLQALQGHYNLTTKTGTFDSVHYRMSGDSNLRGTAVRADVLSDDQSKYRDIVYTTCPPGSSDWSLKASDLLLDRDEGLGTARNARIRLGGVPVFYSPWLQFPIDDRRRSGFLIPSFGVSNNNGLDLAVPYYWNIAPNLDATLTPEIMAARGLMLGVEVRQLTSFQNVTIDGDILPHDDKEPQLGTRYALRLRQNGHLPGGWSSSVDYSSVSDDQYLSDFGNSLQATSVRNLPQAESVTYSGNGYTALGRFQDFQNIDPTVQGKNAPYAQLPHLELNVPAKQWGPIQYDFLGMYDYFDQSLKVHGDRVVMLPSISLPLRRSYGYVMPRVQLYYTGYDLTETSPEQPATQSYVVPSFDLDSKLIFERETSLFGTEVLQTLEPRLYYVLTPYRDQSQTPLFDTTELSFSYASLYRPNRLTGYDRIGDNDRLTVGLTSRTLNSASGSQLLSASIGQIYYFQYPQIQLAGGTPSEDRSSAVAGELEANLAKGLDARASVQWNPNDNATPWEQRVFTLRWAPDEHRIVSMAYRYNLGTGSADHYEDTDLSFQLPIGRNVEVVGRWLYSLANADTVDAFLGIEFGRCCWRLRLIARHLQTSAYLTGSGGASSTATSSGTTSVMLQLELNGLGAFGSSIDKLLQQGIYGYNVH